MSQRQVPVEMPEQTDILQKKLSELQNTRFGKNMLIDVKGRKLMSLKKGSNVQRGYATVADDEGVNYRDIADTMCDIGFSMNHSSARNYVLRVMKKFVEAMAENYGISLTEARAEEIAKSPLFQNGIADLLHTIEVGRRDDILMQQSIDNSASLE